MEVDIEEVRQEAGERFYLQDHQLTVALVDLSSLWIWRQSNNPTGLDLAIFVPTDGSNSLDHASGEGAFVTEVRKEVCAYFNDVE